MGSKKNDAVDRESGKKINALRREEKTRMDEAEMEETLRELFSMRGAVLDNWSLLCGFCGEAIGDCECYSG